MDAITDLISFNQYAWFALAIGIAIAGAVGGAIWLALTTFRGRMDDASYKAQLDALSSGLSDEEELMRLDHGRNLTEKWIIHWRKLAKASGIPIYSDKDNTAPRDVLVLGAAVLLLVNIFLQNPISGPIIGLLAAAGAIYGASMVFQMKYNQEAAKINDQLPGFLFAMKANLEANVTPVHATLKVVDTMPSPLKEDLTIVKQKLLANASFAEALQEMVNKTTSTELRFLGSCLIQAAEAGADISPQLDIIRAVLEQRKAADAELRKAVKATMPSTYVGTFAIPVSLIAAYMLDANAKEFWFKTLYSWIALGAVIALWATGMVLIRRMVNNIKNL